MEIKRVGTHASAKGAIRLVHWNGTHRCSFPSTRFCPYSRRQRNVRTGHKDGMAHASPRADSDRHGGLRLGPAPRGSDRENLSRRCGVVFTRREALAWRQRKHGHDPHRHSGKERWQSGRLDGTGHRRRIPRHFRLTVNAKECLCQRRTMP